MQGRMMKQGGVLAAPAEVHGRPLSQIPLMMPKTSLRGARGDTSHPPGLRAEPRRVRRGLGQSGGHCLAPSLPPHGGGDGAPRASDTPRVQVCSCLPPCGVGQDPWEILPLWVLQTPKRFLPPGESCAHSRGIAVPPPGRNFPHKRPSYSHGGILPHLRVLRPPGGIPAPKGVSALKESSPGGIPVAPESLVTAKGGVPPLSRGILSPGRFLSPGAPRVPDPRPPPLGAWPLGGVSGAWPGGDGDAVGGAGRGGSGGSGGFQRLRRAVSAGGAALPTGDAQPRAGPPGGSSAPVTPVGPPGGAQPPRWGRTRRALPVLPPPGMLCCPPRGCSAPPWICSAPVGLDSAGCALFATLRGCSALFPPPPPPLLGMLPIAPRAGPQ